MVKIENTEYFLTLERRIRKLENDNSNMLKWGVMVLGGAVISLGIYIWGFKVG